MSLVLVNIERALMHNDKVDNFVGSMTTKSKLWSVIESNLTWGVMKSRFALRPISPDL